METYIVTLYCKNIEGRIYHIVKSYANGSPIQFDSYENARVSGDATIRNSMLNNGNVIDYSILTNTERG